MPSRALDAARSKQLDLERERERLAWQIGEIDKLAPGADEWPELDAEHTRLAHAQALLEGAKGALDAIAEADVNAGALTGRALDALQAVADYDPQLAETIEVLQSAQVQLEDAAHTLNGYLNRTDLEPDRLEATRGTPVRLDGHRPPLPAPAGRGARAVVAVEGRAASARRGGRHRGAAEAGRRRLAAL